MTPDEKDRHDEEYRELLALFLSMLSSWSGDDREEALYALSRLRARFAFGHVLKGLGISEEEALRLLNNMGDHTLTRHEKEVRARLQAALDNLIDFSVCEEYQLYEEVLDMVADGEIDMDSDEYEELLLLCKKYNDSYAAVENSDIAYSGVIAALWMKMSASDYVVYWTQNDARVRPWHMALQGYAAPRDEFPSWMIPPIEYNCRCYLEVLERHGAYGKVSTAAARIGKPRELDGVYSESLARCGRIFGPSHSYFNIRQEDKGMLDGFVSRLKKEYYG